MLIDRNTKVKRKKFMFKSIKDKIYILDDMNDNFFELNETASFVWKNISRPKKFGDLVVLMGKKYEVSKKRAIKDLEELIEFLLKRSLIDVNNTQN